MASLSRVTFVLLLLLLLVRSLQSAIGFSQTFKSHIRLGRLGCPGERPDSTAFYDRSGKEQLDLK
ncbi:hypothetical protein ASPWEDRAFT_692020 [Aspergillus wentii DTO 134E9]|uniref:Uncharacterized protein n=1 Tax=Aspergillus wentii DTO 134E9 TaxID=1073089 RepID=A0A1L9R942_ASPWE|nr:uncharacterized protein ASPWEDRAFT_692020 [Aspergillus wentii DTO 134E9]OJJ31445.1 hypothetical protein ASPWEDRAFT_692020 [Aspergillus wentii DTO 134E9]